MALLEVRPTQLSRQRSDNLGVGKHLGKRDHATEVLCLETASELDSKPFADLVDDPGPVGGAFTAKHFFVKAPPEIPVEQGQFGIDRRRSSLPAGSNQRRQFLVQIFDMGSEIVHAE